MTRISLVAMLLLAACEREPVRIDNVSQHTYYVEFVDYGGTPRMIRYIGLQRPSVHELTRHADTP